jgi:uncharacterized membrane protein
MNNPIKTLFSAGLGAAAMYYLDPARGRYRRALVRDQIVHQGYKAKHGASVVGRDTRNRTVGVAATLRSLFSGGQPNDAVLVERVRACLGRAVSHPHSIKVEAADGVITLSGPILEEEVPLLIDCALGVHGVRDLKNQLDVHAEAGDVPGLQGTPRQRPGTRSAFLQTNWSPTARAAGGLGGAVAAIYGFGQRDLAGKIIGAAGLLVLTRALTNLEMRRLFGIGAPRHAVDIQKSIRIHAPVEKVFKLWDNFENFPLFMTHVHRVRRIRTGENKERWRWSVTGPTATELQFDSVVTAREENRLIAWRTEGEAFVQHAGQIHFLGNDDGSTTVDVKMVYNPVAGAVGHAIARLFGTDPKTQMDDDLLRMKSFLETGKLPRDAAEHVAEMPEALKEQIEEQRPNGHDAARQPSEGERVRPG